MIRPDVRSAASRSSLGGQPGGALRRFFFYGILQGGGLHGVDLVDLGPAALKGELFDLGHFPAFLPGRGLVFGRLWEAPDTDTFAAALREFDTVESYRPEAPETSMYRRDLREVWQPKWRASLAYVYVWNAARYGQPHARIPSGRWR